jgi:tetratricopeptide (TPR) repeat protein
MGDRNNAVDSQRQGFLQATKVRAEKAFALTTACPDADMEIAFIRLMDCYFAAKEWTKFEEIANKYLSLSHSGSQAAFKFLEGQAYIRLGIIATEAGKYEQAEAAILRGTEIAKQLGRQDLTASAEKASAALRLKTVDGT